MILDKNLSRNLKARTLKRKLKKYEQLFSRELKETEIKAIKDKKVKKIYQLS